MCFNQLVEDNHPADSTQLKAMLPQKHNQNQNNHYNGVENEDPSVKCVR